MAAALKSIVSKNKRRHVEDGFNLDLSYINDRVIAMGFPAEKVESIYRNSLDNVKRFLEMKHANHYFIYNLCSERYYDSKKFHGRVATYPFDDHHPPTFKSIQPFCQDVDAWLAKDPKNVAVVHCKAGKGRTGVMICCYLLHSGKFTSAQEVLQFYGHARTVDEKGVTIPSQRRYINYYANLVRLNLQYKPVKLYLRYIELDPVPNFNFNFTEFYVQIDVKQAGREKYESPDFLVKRVHGKGARLVLPQPVLVCGDVKIEFSSKSKLDLLPKRSKEFHFWFNTFFVEESFNSDLCHKVKRLSSTSSSDDNNGFKSHSLDVYGSTDALETNGGHDVSGGRALGRHASCIGGEKPASRIEDDLQILTLGKAASVSDDTLTQSRSGSSNLLLQQPTAGPGPHVKMVTSTTSSSSSSSAASIGAPLATQHSFTEQQRMRHVSLPQTSSSSKNLVGLGAPGPATLRATHLSHRPPPDLDVAGSNVKMRLDRPQIDKVAKDKTNKYAEYFSVTVCLFRPDDQSNAGELDSKTCSKASPDSSSEEDSDGVLYSSDHKEPILQSGWVWRQKQRFRRLSTSSLVSLRLMSSNNSNVSLVSSSSWNDLS